MQNENAKNNEEINKIKISSLDLEKEVGGFRFVAEAFGMELKNVVKFFIFLIVIVFDPLAVALIIAFNGLIETKKQKQSRLLGEMMEYDEKLGLYDNLDDLMHENYKDYQIYGDNGKKSPKIEENGVIMENIVNENKKDEINLQNEEKLIESDNVVDADSPIVEDLTWEPYMHPEFPWNKKELWINNQKAVQYWLKNKGSAKDLQRIKREDDNVKTY